MADKKQALISQSEVDDLLNIHDLIEGKRESQTSLIDEIKAAILDSGKLKVEEWRSLRERIREIETLIPHMDLIINLKEAQERRNKILGRP